jgi:uncharacterized protein YndB with AHSA1/START domain
MAKDQTMMQKIDAKPGIGLPELRLSRIFAAPRARVFEAWGSADRVKRWFCPAAYSVPQATVEMHVGGPFEVCMRSPEGVDYWIRGRFTEVAPFDRLAIEMDVAAADNHLLFSAHTLVTFAEDAGGTRLEVAQTYTLRDPDVRWMIEGAPAGWNETLDRLAAELARPPGGGEGARSVVHATFRLERSYPAPVAQVWQALTDERAKAKWFAGPAGDWQPIERQMDVRVNGRERLKGRWKGGVVSTFDAVYHDVVPHERLLYAYDMHLDDRKISVSLATVQLARDGANTRLTITEQGAFLDGYDDAGARERGTGALLDALGASLVD